MKILEDLKNTENKNGYDSMICTDFCNSIKDHFQINESYPI